MEHQYSFDADWRSPDRHNHAINVNLDVTLTDLLQGKDIAVELMKNEQSLRREIMEMVIHGLIPDIISNSNVNGSLPEGKTRTSSNADTHSEWSIEDSNETGSSPSIRSKLQILFEINSDRAMNAMQALHVSNGVLATAITDDILLSLKTKYLGASAQEASSSVKTKNGKIADYSAKSSIETQSA